MGKIISFTKSECESIIGLSNSLPIIIRDGITADVKRPDADISYNWYMIYRTHETQWIFDRLYLFFKESTGYDIIEELDKIQLHKYQVGDKFKKHQDIYNPNQIYNLGVCLNDDYGDGEFVLYNPNEILPKKQGAIYGFRCNRYHEVKEITSGVRWSIIGFMFENHTNMKKTLL